MISGVRWHDGLNVRMNDTVHRPMERLARLRSAVEKPTPAGWFLGLPVGRLPVPRHVPPKDRFVEGRGLPDGARVDAVVEEHDERTTPVAADWKRTLPHSRSPHLVRREGQGIDLRFGHVVPPSHVPLGPGLREAERRFEDFLFPGPGNDGPRVLTAVKPIPAPSQNRLRLVADHLPLGADGPTLFSGNSRHVA